MNPEEYLIIIDGQGEFATDFSVLRGTFGSPREAVDHFTDPKQGYGKTEDGRVFVVRVKDVSSFRLNPGTRILAEPCPVQELVEV